MVWVRDGQFERIPEHGGSLGEAHAVFLEIALGLLGIPFESTV
jgi:hypothetical protein